MPQHHLIYIPGLNDHLLARHEAFRLLPLCWRLQGFRGHIVYPNWHEGEFEPKLAVVLAAIDALADQGHPVSLLGQSAGGSLALNVFIARRDRVNGLVNLTGRLRVAGLPSLETAAHSSPAFAESVRRAEAVLGRLAAADRRRIMTIRPASDHVVPPSSVPIPGATNVVSRVPGHALGGAVNASALSRCWLVFLKSLP